MEKVQIECPHCGYTAKVREELNGKKTRCPECERIFTIEIQKEKTEENAPTANTRLCVCPSCGFDVDVPEDAMGQDVLCSLCKEVVVIQEEKPYYCPFCKGLISSDAQICRHCHKKITIAQSLIATGKQFKKKGSVTLIGQDYNPEIYTICHSCNSKIKCRTSDIDTLIVCNFCKENTHVDNTTLEKCPFCGNQIALDAKVCRHCKKSILNSIAKLAYKMGTASINPGTDPGMKREFFFKKVFSKEKWIDTFDTLKHLFQKKTNLIFPGILLLILSVLAYYSFNNYDREETWPVLLGALAGIILGILTTRKFPQTCVPWILAIICGIVFCIYWCHIGQKHVAVIVVNLFCYLLPVLFVCWTNSGIYKASESVNSEMSQASPETSISPAGTVYTRCTHCNTLFAVEPEWQGLQTTCSNCQQQFTINIEK